jgi:hypothetical protein
VESRTTKQGFRDLIAWQKADRLASPTATIATLENARVEAGRVVFGLWRSLKAMNKSDWDHTGAIREEAGLYVVP